MKTYAVIAGRSLGRMAAGTLTTLSLVGSAAFGADLKVIYGDDHRRDLWEVEGEAKLTELSRSTAVLVRREDVGADENDASSSILKSANFGDSLYPPLCETEPFRDQPSAGFCSGFLVGEDIFVTAGHCVRDQPACEGIAFVFDFSVDTPDRNPAKVKKKDIFLCKELIARQLDFGEGSDYAVIRLDRKVEGRRPLSFRTTEKVAANTELTVIGHPSGLPTKVAGGAAVRENNLDLPFFRANLDTYGGNSGSAVFNTQTGVVEGILVRGEQDFKEEDGCTVSFTCTDDGCRGEDVTRATEFAPHVIAALTSESPAEPIVIAEVTATNN